MNKISSAMPRLSRALMMAGVASAALGLGQARAFEFNYGDWQVNLDTTLSSSVGIRTGDRDLSKIGIANGGTYGTANADNGNLNYDVGDVVLATQRVTTELQGKKDDYGFFIRATGFYDPSIVNDPNDFRFPYSHAAIKNTGFDFRLLDAYAFFRPQLFGHDFDVRVGNQALNWGESTFIQFGLNSITPLDVTALRVPGSELRTAFLAVPAVDIKTEIAPDTTFEAFWQPYWRRFRLEPVGSFFSTNDGLLDGGKFNNYFSLYPDDPAFRNAVSLAQNNPFGAQLWRSLDSHPTGVGQYGFAVRHTFPEINDLEIGVYYENIHSRIPFASFRTGQRNISVPALGPGSEVLPDPLGSLFGSPGIADKTYSSTDSFYADYPKDIKIMGFSWNFIAPGGVAIQGEVTHRFDQPVQLAGADLALAVNAPAICAAAGVSPLLAAACQAAKDDPVIQAAGGIPNFNSSFKGYVRRDVTQGQITGTKLFAAEPALGINSIALVGEIGFDYVHNFGKYGGLYNAPFSTSDNSAFEQAGTVNTVPTPGQNRSVGYVARKNFTTPFSASYTVATIIDMPNVLPYGIGMKPTFSLRHDFRGTSPLGVNVFVQNTAAASAGVTFSYLQAWSFGMQYTNYFPIFGAGKNYALIDRDFFSATLNYQF